MIGGGLIVVEAHWTLYQYPSVIAFGTLLKEEDQIRHCVFRQLALDEGCEVGLAGCHVAPCQRSVYAGKKQMHQFRDLVFHPQPCRELISVIAFRDL